MTARDRKKLLVVIDVILAAAIAGSIAVALMPLEQAAPAPAESPVRTASAPAKARIGQLEDYAVIYRRDLHRPLFDPPATQVATAPAVLPIRLNGTAVEPGNSYGIFRTSTNEVKLAGVGEIVDGAEILEITATSATVRFNGIVSKLAVEAKP